MTELIKNIFFFYFQFSVERSLLLSLMWCWISLRFFQAAPVFCVYYSWMIRRRGLTLLLWRTQQILLGIIHLFCEFNFRAPPASCACHISVSLQPWTPDVSCSLLDSELNGLSKELNIKLVNQEQLDESKEPACPAAVSALSCVSLGVNEACGVFSVDSLLGQVSVPFDLVKKHPKGQQTFALKTKDGAVGSLTTEVRTATLSHTNTDLNFVFPSPLELR